MTRRLPAELGEVIGGYRLDELISRGGMGSVYKATHAVLGRIACVKVLDRSLAMDDGYVARFLKEAKIVNDVRHENIVDIFDFVQSQSPRRVACIMEYIHGRTLNSVLAQGALTVVQSVNATLQLIDALRAVHAKGVIHRDIKPNNIMVVAPFQSDFSVHPAVKILDFGIAKVEGSNSIKTGPGTMLGTPAYMAPEQISGDRITAKTDVYALGEIFYEMVSAHRIYSGTNANDIIKLKLLGELPALRFPAHLRGVERIRWMIEACLSSDAGRRPALGDLEVALLEIRRENQGPIATRPVLERTPSVPPPGDTEPVPAPSQAVRRIGEYYCFAELPARGMTQAFVARKQGQVEICTLKRLLQHLTENATATARFTREARIAQHLVHPRLARLFDASIQESTLVLASEFIIGQPLDAIFDRLLDMGQRMPLQVLAPIALGVLDGLAYAHAATDTAGRPLSIVHRDLTPNAIIVAFSGDVKIRDFGIARASVDDFRTSPGMAVGSIEYMSPEQARSQPIDHRSDLYTFSTVLYEALSGRPVVRQGATILDTLKSVTGDRPPPLTEARPDLTAPLVAAIERGLEKDPARRWQGAAEYRAALGAALGRFSDASLDVVGDFLRALMPEEEQRAVDLLAQIREAGEQLPVRAPLASGARGERERAEAGAGASPERAPLASGGRSERPRAEAGPEQAHEPTITVRRRTAEEPGADEHEPSVMTMPGAPAPLERGSSVAPIPRVVSVATSSPSPRVPWLAGGIAVAAVVLLLAVVLVRPPAPDRAPQDLARVEAVEVEPEVAPKAPPYEQPVAVEEAEAVEARKPAAKPQGKRPHPAVVKPPPRAVPPPPEPPRPPPARTIPFAGIRRQLAQLRSNPKDVKLFDQTLAAISQATRDLPADGRRRVKVDLDAAERTYDVELLAAALNKLALETARSK